MPVPCSSATIGFISSVNTLGAEETPKGKQTNANNCNNYRNCKIVFFISRVVIKSPLDSTCST